MSGVFWEADKQPNLCEAASGFTLSTVIYHIANSYYYSLYL